MLSHTSIYLLPTAAEALEILVPTGSGVLKRRARINTRQLTVKMNVQPLNGSDVII